MIASNARSDLLGKNNARARNSSLAKSFWCYLLSAQKVAKTLQTRFNALIIRYFCLTKVTKNNPDDENLLRPPSEIGKRATARFCEQNVPVSFPISAVARLTHFHRSGTWLAPTDISQTFFTLFLFRASSPAIQKNKGTPQVALIFALTLLVIQTEP